VACHALASQALSASCLSASATLSTSSALNLTNFANGTGGWGSGCASAPVCSAGGATNQKYQIYGLTNHSGSATCYTVTVTPGGATACSGACSGSGANTKGLFAAVYQTSFSPGAACTNWLADSGSTNITGITPRTFTVQVAASTKFFIIVSEFFADAVTPGGCGCSYSLDVSATSCSNPTAATFQSVTATAYAGRVLVQWQTGLEVDNLGFNIYREQGGTPTRVNPQLIAGSALLVGRGTTLQAGGSYAWVDASPSGTENAQYWLEDIDLSGKSTWHGPVSVVPSTSPTPPSGQAALLSSLGRRATQQPQSGPVERRATLGSRGVGVSSPTPSGLPVTDLATGQWPPASQTAVKLAVRKEGWYRVPQLALVAAGLNPQGD